VGVSSSAGHIAGGGVCIYVLLVIIFNKYKKRIVRTDFPNKCFYLYLIIVYL
jgi:hypothetical protein